MDGDRQRRVGRLIAWGAIVWAIGQVILSAVLLWAFYAQDDRTLRLAIYTMIGFGPAIMVTTYLEARAHWLGKSDTEIAAALALASIMGGLVLLAWHLG